MYLKRLLFAVLLSGLVSYVPTQAAAQPSAQRGLVLGSYLNRTYADERRAEVEAIIGAPVSVIQFGSGNDARYRVIYVPTSNQDLATRRQQMVEAGFADAWITPLNNKSYSSPVLVDRQPVNQKPVERDSPQFNDTVKSQPEVKPPPREIADPAKPKHTTAPRNPARTETIELATVGTDVRIQLPKMEEGAFEFDLDGRLDEPFWRSIPGYDNMLVTDPDTMEKPRYATITRWFYTDKGIYFGVHLKQPPDTLIARLSSRDEFLNRDAWGITLDTSGQGLYGYWFTVNLGGSVQDGKVAAERRFSNEWDGPWESKTAVLDDGWSTEVFLPWSMMTMPDVSNGVRQLGFYISRKVAHIDERYTWPALPFGAPAFMSVLAQAETPGVSPKRQLEIYPNVSYTLDEIDSEDEYRVGADISWRPSTNFQVTATLNPDFGVVESDDVVVNLSSFETFFPEKRLFFLEGREVFQTTPRNRVSGRGPSGTGSRQTTSTFNPEPTTMLNTRRIGGPPRVDIPDDVDVAGVERGKPSDLLGAVKLTGQNGPLRYGVLAAFEDDGRLPGTFDAGPNAGLPARVEYDGRDFGVARVLYERTGNGRQSIGYMGTRVGYTDSDAVVHGVDAHWLSPNGLWEIDTQLMYSDVDDETGSGIITDVSYKPRQGVQHQLQFDYLDDQLNIRDLGFIRRNDAQRFIYRYNHSTGRGLKRLRGKNNSIFVSQEWNTDGRSTRSGLFFRNGWTFHNLNEIRTEFDYFPARWDDRNSFGNGDYKVDDRFVAEVGFGTNTSKPFSFSALLGMRQEELSDWTTRAALGFTFKPNDRFSLDLDLSYFDRKGWLLHQTAYGRSDPLFDRTMTTFDAQEFQPRLAMDLFISAKQQLRLTMQWAGIRAEERERFLIPINDGDLIPVTLGPTDSLQEFTVSRMATQLRYRWEIGPLSDLFVVYTRGSNLPDRMDDSFSDLYVDALEMPIIDLFVIKLRYRFGL